MPISIRRSIDAYKDTVMLTVKDTYINRPYNKGSTPIKISLIKIKDFKAKLYVFTVRLKSAKYD